MTELPGAMPTPQDNVPNRDAHYQMAQRIAEWLAGAPAPDSGVPSLLPSLQRVFRLLLDHIAAREPLHFTTPFSLIAYIGHKYQLPGASLHILHRHRRLSALSARQAGKTDPREATQLAYQALCILLERIFELPLPEGVVRNLAALPRPEAGPERQTGHQALVRVQILSIDANSWVMEARDEEDPSTVRRVQGHIPDRNEDFTPLLQALVEDGRFPVRMNLLDCHIDANGTLQPLGFVLEPDHLLDVTTIAECFTPGGEFPVLGLLRQFLPAQVSKPILIGNIANHFLDRLLQYPQLPFQEAFSEVFGLFPLALSTLNDEEVKDIYQSSRLHFQTLSMMVQSGLEKAGIIPDECYLEPSFYNPDLGIQGRLDVLQLPADTRRAPSIVELKSGKPFRENSYGLSANHYIQTLLYSLLVRDLRPEQTAQTYILYSQMSDNPLRIAPVVKARQRDALRVRNALLLQDQTLAALDADRPETWQILDAVHPRQYPGLYGFSRHDLTRFERVWNGLSELEKAYFVQFAGFTFREFRIAKTGVVGTRRTDGQSAFWLSPPAEKIEQFSLLAYLEIEADLSHESDPLLHLRFTDQTPPLSHFRAGDIALLYPETGQDQPTREQVWKCTLMRLDQHSATVRLRATQWNKRHFTQFRYWHLERDFLDSSFLHLTRSLFQFAEAPASSRQRLLGLTPPGRPQAVDVHLPDALTAEQQGVIRAMMAAPDYYLLWGPPGTGKTSMVLRHLVGALHTQTRETVLLLAYTNRAVDEICDAIQGLGPEYREAYLRVGSRFSTAEPYRARLLDAALATCTNRAQVRERLRGMRIFVGTVSSLLGKSELLSLVSFDRVVVDEASQLPEPLICGLLVRFPRFVLIGDHRQLPAVVMQSAAQRHVRAPLLRQLGIQDSGQSLFERLYRQVTEQGWTHAYGMLAAQGRMHEDIMAFPNRHFYEGRLQTIRPDQALDLADPEVDHPFHAMLNGRRMVFLPVSPDQGDWMQRTNAAEARQLVVLVQYYQQLYAALQKPWTADTLGIITPFRAQIALIRQVFSTANLNPEDYTIDTVERYQGGAREIILISWCIQHPAELDTIRSSEEGVDRKLNVALTRARERLVALGHPPALEADPLYRQFMDSYRVEGLAD